MAQSETDRLILSRVDIAKSHMSDADRYANILRQAGRLSKEQESKYSRAKSDLQAIEEAIKAEIA